MKYLINNADDFGWGEDITRGIIDSHLKGVLTSASVIINEIDKESLKLIGDAPTLGLGIHLNIATGKPLMNVWPKDVFSHPVRNSLSEPYKQSMWDQMYSKFDTKLIFSEFESQLELFKKLIGKLPDHLDTHYNTFSVENVFDAYIQLAKKYNLPVRHPVGYVGDSEFTDFSHSTSELVVINDFLEKLKKEKVRMTTKFSLEYINLHENYIDAILKEVAKINDGESIEISYHPGYRENWRRKQVEILIDPLLKKAFDEHNVKVINYSELR